MTKNSNLTAPAQSSLVLLTLLIWSLVPDGHMAKAETVGNSNPSPIYRALHPDTSVDNQIVTFHFGNDTFNVPRNYLIGGSDVPRPNEPGGFIIEVLLPDLVPRPPENQDRFTHVAPGLGDVIRVNVEYNIHLSPIDDVLDRIVIQRDNPNKYSITSSGLKKYKTFTEDIYIKQNDKLQDIFLQGVWGIYKNLQEKVAWFMINITKISLYIIFSIENLLMIVIRSIRNYVC